jgi:hypothetical protein
MTNNMLNYILLNFSQITESYSFKVSIAIFVLIAGWIISKWSGKRTALFMEKTKINQIIKRLGTEDALTEVDVRLSAPIFFGGLVRWCLFTVFVLFFSVILNFGQLSQFLITVIDYFPNIFAAVIIFFVAVFLADLAKKIVVGSFEKEKITYSRFLGRGISWGIWLLAILAILYQLEIVKTLVLIIFVGAVAMIVITVGVAFGMGGKNLAAKILKELDDKFK